MFNFFDFNTAMFMARRNTYNPDTQYTWIVYNDNNTIVYNDNKTIVYEE